MSYVATNVHSERVHRTRTFSGPVFHAYRLLHIAFMVAPIVAGLDKFFNVLTYWEKYLSPTVASISPLSPHNTMLVVGLVEMAVGLYVIVKPRIAAYILAIWLWAIVANLMMMPGYYDIALRDFGLSLGAIALGRLADELED
jgi:hypothetical protein